jgi:alpha-galactosidase
MQTLRATPLETRFNVSAYGCLGYELDLSLLSRLERIEVAKQIAFYKQHRHTFQYGRFYRGDQDEYETFEVKDDETMITKFRRIVHAVPVYDKLYLHDLDDEKVYRIESKPYLHNLKQFGHLINFVSPVKLNSEGKIVDTLSKIKGMEASIQTYEASGAALKSGIYLNNLFLGTGYNDNVRIPLDYGSDMYEVKEIQ